MSDVDRLLSAIPITSYIERYLPLKKKGNNYWANCPFHNENSPSFSVSAEKGIFKCFGCGKGGNLITFVQEYEKVDFVEALKILSEFSGIPLEGGRSKRDPGEKDHKTLLYNLHEKVQKLYRSHIGEPDAASYLKGRSIEPEAIDHFRLGYAPQQYQYLENKLLSGLEPERAQKGRAALMELGLLGQNDEGQVYNRFRDRLIFPISDLKGNTVAFGGRIIRELKKAGKYINSPETPIFHKGNSLYHLYESREETRKAGQVILVEGYLDVLGLYQKGIANVVAPLGTAFTEGQARLLKRYSDHVIFFFDADDAGVEASFKSLAPARKEKLQVRVVVQSDRSLKADPFDLCQKLDHIEIMALLDSAKSETAFVLWYFFSFKFNISNIGEKRVAMDEFFAFLDTLEQEWERQDYFSEAAKALKTDVRILSEGYKNYKKGVKTAKRPQEGVIPQVVKVPRIEKEILALLLRFPAFWQKGVLLDELKLAHQKVYLLFSFFRDRLKAGEFWSWDELSKVVAKLPEELSGLLSEIIIEMDEVFKLESEGINAELTEAEQEERFLKKLESLIFMHKRDRLEKEIKIRRQALSAAETMEEDVEQLTSELADLIAAKGKVDIFLSER